MIRYLRHASNPSVILAEREALDAFRSKRSLEDTVQSLQTEIDSVKRELHELKELLKTKKDSE